jgi:branched-chain amino acid transport system permease protein
MTALWESMNGRGKLLVVLLILALLMAPMVASPYLLSVLTLILYFVYVGQAWNLMMGYAGQLSLGHALYVGLGGYVAAILWVHYGIGPWLSVVPAVAIAAAFGATIGWLAFRFGIEGVYFALLTIAFAEFTRIGFDHLTIAGGAGGLFIPYEEQRIGEWWNLRGNQLFFYYLAFALAAGGVLITALLSRARLGFQWLAIREDEMAARALGIDAFRAKMKAVLISSGMTAVGGVFYAFYNNTLFPAQMFDMSRSIELILAPIVGGLGTIFGPVVGAFILTPLGEILIMLTDWLGINLPGVKAVFYGLTLMIIISLVPTGVWPRIARSLDLKKHGP